MTVPAVTPAAGVSAADLAMVETLRRKGYRGAVTALGAEPHLPYGRQLRADAVGVATGARPRTLPGQPRMRGMVRCG
ncbi:hypothetical protein ACNTMW_02220 [Planosporangium sp. 12N6]|uniref:hypothetical protein n=1 Tax=Planosporangium spinosum TaxID=3402278 RepID=UPI003CF24EDC